MFGKDKDKKPSADELMAEFLSKSAPQIPEKKSELQLKFEALWLLLQDKLGLTEQELETYISQLKGDSSEQLEEALDSEVQQCPKCSRTLSVKTGFCVYCGKDEE